MVVTKCSIVTGGSRHKVVIVSVSVVEPGACDVGVWLEACPSGADSCMPSRDNMDLSGLVSPPPDSIGPFPVIVDV